MTFHPWRRILSSCTQWEQFKFEISPSKSQKISKYIFYRKNFFSRHWTLKYILIWHLLKSVFLDRSQDISSCSFPPKNRPDSDLRKTDFSTAYSQSLTSNNLNSSNGPIVLRIYSNFVHRILKLPQRNGLCTFEENEKKNLSTRPILLRYLGM